LRMHIQKGCLEDPAGVDLHQLDVLDAALIGDEHFYRFRCRRGTSALESYHGQQKRWLSSARHSLHHGLALIADGTQRHNRKRGPIACNGTMLARNVFAAGLLSSVDGQYQTHMARETTALGLPVRSLSHATDTLATEARAPTPSITNEPAARPAEPNAESKLNKDMIQVEHQSSQAPFRSQDAAASGAVASKRRSTARGTARPSTRRGTCSHCKQSEAQCRRHDGIYWCAAKGLPFDEWKRFVFPAKKAAAREAAAKRAARVGMQTGRPRNKKDIDKE
jgi:hypothetical protein